jgi:hypothetical protein
MQTTFEQELAKPVTGQGQEELSQHVAALAALMVKTKGRSDLVRVVTRRVAAVGRELDRRGLKPELSQAVTR